MVRYAHNFYNEQVKVSENEEKNWPVASEWKGIIGSLGKDLFGGSSISTSTDVIICDATLISAHVSLPSDSSKSHNS